MNPKYLQVEEWIKENIKNKNFKNGDKLLSENALMEKFGFSRQTIRLAISNLESQGLVERIKGSGTYVNIKSGTKTDNKYIGVVIPTIDNWVAPRFIESIEQVLRLNGYDVVLGVTHSRAETEAEVLKDMIERQVSGIIVCGHKTAIQNPNSNLYKHIQENIPCVFIGYTYPNVDIPRVFMDDVSAGYDAVKYLVSMHHTQIAGIFNSDDIDGRKKYEGYMKALQNSNLSINDKGCLWYTSEDFDGMIDKGIERLFSKRFLNCTAVICNDDIVATKVIDYLQSVNKKPFEDMSIMSFSSTDLSEMMDLTAMIVPKNRLGYKAAESLMEQIRLGVVKDHIIPAELVIRKSVVKREFRNSWGSAGIFEN